MAWFPKIKKLFSYTWKDEMERSLECQSFYQICTSIFKTVCDKYCVKTDVCAFSQLFNQDPYLASYVFMHITVYNFHF